MTSLQAIFTDFCQCEVVNTCSMTSFYGTIGPIEVEVMFM